MPVRNLEEILDIDDIWNASINHIDIPQSKLKNRNIKYASTFLNIKKTDLWNIVSKIIYDNMETINKWLLNSIDDTPLAILSDECLDGIGFINSKDIVKPNKTIVILKKRLSNKEQFFIATVFPYYI